jgi:hypothetical protein
MTLDYSTKRLKRESTAPLEIKGDICVVGAGIAGVSAALETAQLGRRVILIDSGQTLGGQSVGSMIGTFCGLFSNGPKPYQVTHGIADNILHDLQQTGAVHFMYNRRNTTIVQYRIEALGRWIDESIRRAGITVLLGGVLRSVRREGTRILGLDIATRHGDVLVAATGYVDASGDATLAWLAGLPVQEPADVKIYGSMMFSLENVNDAALNSVDRKEIKARLKEKAAAYELVRFDGFAFIFPGVGETLINMTHFETPLTPSGHAEMLLEGRRQCDQLVKFLRNEFPNAFSKATVRSYGLPGIRQTRWIVGGYTLTADDVRTGREFPDTVVRCTWPIEIYDAADEATWEIFGDDHMHYVPLRSLVPPETENLVAVGRCIDADVVALSSVRVMGPCIGMGAVAAHALDLAGDHSLHRIDVPELQRRLKRNLTETT